MLFRSIDSQMRSITPKHLVEQPGFDHVVVLSVAKAAHLEEMRGLSTTWNWIAESNKGAERESTGRWERHPRGPVLPERARSECARSTGAVGLLRRPFPMRRGKQAWEDHYDR